MPTTPYIQYSEDQTLLPQTFSLASILSDQAYVHVEGGLAWIIQRAWHIRVECHTLEGIELSILKWGKGSGYTALTGHFRSESGLVKQGIMSTERGDAQSVHDARQVAEKLAQATGIKLSVSDLGYDA